MLYRIDTKEIEQYALKRIADDYDLNYISMRWNEKADKFDYTTDDGSKALEVTTVISNELKDVLTYDAAKRKNGYADMAKVRGAIEWDENQELRKTYGGSLGHYIDECIKAMDNKNKKAVQRIAKGEIYASIELSICICEAPFFNELSDVDFMSERFLESIFSKLFFITRDRLFVFEKIEAK